MKEVIIFIADVLQGIPMKQLALLMSIFVLGSLGAMYHPFWALLLYYVLSILRPQYIWKWALPVEWRWSLFAAFVVFVSVLINLPRMAVRSRMNTFAWLLILYSMCLGMSVVLAHNPAVAQRWAIEFGKIAVVALIASIAIENLWQIRFLLIATTISLGYVAWEVNVMYLIHHRLTIYHHGFGGLDNNGAGLMLAMGVPLAYAFAMSSRKIWVRGCFLIAALLMLHSVLMSYSRGAMLSLAVGFGWLLLHHRPRLQAALMAISLVIATSFLAGPEIRDRFASTKDFQTDGSAQSRFDSWDAAWSMIWDNPIFGKGVRNANLYSSNYGADRLNRTIHNQYLQIGADSGLPAMLLYIAMMVLSLIGLHRSRRAIAQRLMRIPECADDPDTRELRQTHVLLLATQTSLMIFAIGGMFLSLEVFELPWMLMVIAGVLPRALEQRLGDAPLPIVPEPVVSGQPMFEPSPAVRRSTINAT